MKDQRITTNASAPKKGGRQIDMKKFAVDTEIPESAKEFEWMGYKYMVLLVTTDGIMAINQDSGIPKHVIFFPHGYYEKRIQKQADQITTNDIKSNRKKRS